MSFEENFSAEQGLVQAPPVPLDARSAASGRVFGGRSILGFPPVPVCQFYERPTAYKVPQYTLREAYAIGDLGGFA